MEGTSKVRCNSKSIGYLNHYAQIVISRNREHFEIICFLCTCTRTLYFVKRPENGNKKKVASITSKSLQLLGNNYTDGALKFASK